MTSDSGYQPGLIYHNHTWKTANQIVAESNALAGVKPLTEQFPVSTGMEHKASDAQTKAVGNVFASQQVGVVFERGFVFACVSAVGVKV